MPPPGLSLPDYDHGMLTIATPQTDKEFSDYYQLRWALLRQPWQQPQGSEKDEFESQAIHRYALLDNEMVAVARLHTIDSKSAQIRYMAVKAEVQRQGIATALLTELEQQARQQEVSEIILHARETALGFYRIHGYKVIEKTHLLYDEIQHFKMQKKL